MNAAPLKKGDLIRRLTWGQNTDHPRLFRILFVDAKAGVFSAKPADGEWMGWGGTYPPSDTYEIVKEKK